MRKLFALYKLPLAAFAAIISCGYLSMATMPYLIGSLVAEWGMDEKIAGLIGTLELAATAGVAILVSPRMHRLPRRRMAIWGMAIACTSHLLSTMEFGLAVMIMFRILAGAGAGFALAAGNAIIAGSADPTKAYARMIVLYAIVMPIYLVITGTAVAHWGAAGAYGMEALWILIAFPLIFLMPKEDKAKDHEKLFGDRPPWALGILGIIAVFLWHTSDTSVYGFSERVAASVGFNPAETGWVLGAAAMTGGIGAFLASILGDRFGHAKPIVIGGALYILCCSALTSAQSVNAYIVAQISYTLCYTFTAPYIYGVVGNLDRYGRVLVAASAGGLIGAAIAPYLAGSLTERGGYGLIGQFVGFSAMLIILLMVTLAHQINRKQTVLD